MAGLFDVFQGIAQGGGGGPQLAGAALGMDPVTAAMQQAQQGVNAANANPSGTMSFLDQIQQNLQAAFGMGGAGSTGNALTGTDAMTGLAGSLARQGANIQLARMAPDQIEFTPPGLFATGGQALTPLLLAGMGRG